MKNKDVQSERKLNKVWNKTKLYFYSWFAYLKEKKVFISIIMILVLIFSIVIWTCLISTSPLIAGGSTSVNLILEDLTNQYRQEDKGGDDVIYNSLGSASALVGVKNNSYSFGFLSEEISDADADDLYENYNTLRFAFAKDYFILFYNLPEGSVKSAYSSDNGDFLGNHLVLGDWTDESSPDYGPENIQDLYSGNYTWKQVYGDQLYDNSQTDDIPVRFTREAGSGTRSFFDNDVIETKDYNYTGVSASNGSMFENVVSTPGSIGYVSFSYLPRIIDEYRSGDHNVHIAFVKKSDGSIEPPYQYNKEHTDVNADNPYNVEYDLIRPFIGIINTSSPDFDRAMKFVTWMLAPAFYDQSNPMPPPNKDDAAYWYLKDGASPIFADDDYFNKFIDYNGQDDQITKNIFDYMQEYKDLIPGY